MSISTLLSRNAMNSVSSHMDDQRAYHSHIGNHLARELKSLSLGMSWKNHHHAHSDNDTHCYSPEGGEHISNQNLSLLPDNLYDTDYSKPIHSIESTLLDEEPFNQLNINGGCSRKSANMTETVPVPSSEHVAEIVGRQGCKIKSLRTQTNTYIKTPVRGAEPVFVVTGRKEDVAKAKQQILSAADHFSSIRAKRNGSAGSQGSSQTANSGTCSPTSNPGNLTILVKVPYKVVGLVVGPKGATIKRIQQITATYIVTPGRDKEPVFEVTGSPEQVERAREEIEKHIISRTAPDNNSDMQIDDFQVNGVDYSDQNTNATSSNCSGKYGMIIHDNMPSSPAGTTHSHYHPIVPPATSIASHHNHVNPQPIGSSTTGSTTNQSHHHLPMTSSMPISDYSMLPNYSNLHHNKFKSNSSEFDHDEGIGTSGSTVSVYDPSAFWGDVAYEVQRSNSVSIARKNEMLPSGEDDPHPRTRRTNSDPISAAFQTIDASTFTSSGADEQRKLSILDRRHRLQSRAQSRTCMECERNVANAALVPCGHNTFCGNCASEICRRELERRLCPLCFQVPEQAIIIRN